MVHEPITLNAFDSGVDPKAINNDDQCPHHMPTHLKEGIDAIEGGKRIVVYVLKSHKRSWYVFEKVPLGKEEWNEPGDGELVGSTNRLIRDRLGCQSDADCIRHILAKNGIPLMPRAVYEEGAPQALSLLKHPELTPSVKPI